MLPFACTTSPSALSRPAGERGLHLGQVEAGLGDGDGRADVDALGDLGLESLRGQMAPGIERDDLARLAPLRERADADRRVGIGEIRPADRIERAGGHRERAIERIGAAMAADDVAVAGPRHRADDRAAFARGWRTPVDREARLAAGLRMRGEADVVGSVRAIHFTNPKSHRPAGGGGPNGQISLASSGRQRGLPAAFNIAISGARRNKAGGPGRNGPIACSTWYRPTSRSTCPGARCRTS